MRTLLLSIVLLLTAYGQAQELLNQDFWPNGAIRSTRYAEGGRIHFITYHENGFVKDMGSFDNGKRDGSWKQYSDTGALTASAHFENGRRQGIWEFRTSSDKPMGRLTFQNGVLLKGHQYNDTGDLVAQRDYR